jgi:hypothetical protein
MKTNISSLRVFIESQGLIQGPLRAGARRQKCTTKIKTRKIKQQQQQPQQNKN